MRNRKPLKLLALLAALFIACTGAVGCNAMTAEEISAVIASLAPLPSEAGPDATADISAEPEPTLSPAAGPAVSIGTPSATPVPTPEPVDDGFIPGSSVLAFNYAEVPSYNGEPYVVVHGNEPFFDPREISAESFEFYSPLDALGRCGIAWASVSQELMPTEGREDISTITPSGWNQTQLDGEWLYNRCHLIGFQLTGENAEPSNLITGTRYLNIEGMLPFENMVADYIKETGNHVMYRATPYFAGEELVCRGVLLEGLSVEDGGEDICFCVFAYNVQPGVEIYYADGGSSAHLPAVIPSEGNLPAVAATPEPTAAPTLVEPTLEPVVPPVTASYIGNKNTGKFHVNTCTEIKKMKESNKVPLSSREEALANGYQGCKRCNP